MSRQNCLCLICPSSPLFLAAFTPCAAYCCRDSALCESLVPHCNTQSGASESAQFGRQPLVLPWYGIIVLFLTCMAVSIVVVKHSAMLSHNASGYRANGVVTKLPSVFLPIAGGWLCPWLHCRLSGCLLPCRGDRRFSQSLSSICVGFVCRQP